MSEDANNPETNDADLLAPPGPPPRPWPYILVGLGGALVLGITALILIRSFIMSRPLDLIPTTDALAAHLAEVLRLNLVPEEDIKHGTPQRHDEAMCHWNHYEFEVKLSPRMSVEGMRKLLIDGMAERRARVSGEDPLEFSFGPYPFATVTFTGGATAPEPKHGAEHAPGAQAAPEPHTEEPQAAPAEQKELRLLSLLLSGKVAEALLNAGVPKDKLIVGDPIEESRDRADWLRTRLQVVDWTPPTADALLNAVNSAASAFGASASSGENGLLTVALEGYPVVELALGGEAAPQIAPEHPEPAPAPQAPVETPMSQSPTTPAAPMPAPVTPAEKEDLRPACVSLAKAVGDGLVDAGVVRAALAYPPERASEDSNAIWKLSLIQVRGGTTIKPEELLAATMKHAAGAEIEGSVDESAGPPELHYKIKGHLCVIVELQPRAVETPEPPTEMAPEGQHEGETAPPLKGDTAHPKVAIILDDGGNTEAVGDAVLKLDPKYTLAILPHTKFGRQIAERGKELGFEIMLHQPMEPLGGDASDKGMLRVGMSAEEVARVTLDNIAEVPGLTGINNHKGSKFTSDPASMEVFFQAIKGQPYFFIDSVTAGKSKAFESAKTAGFRAGRRDVFLDDKSDAAYIRKQFEILHKKAKKNGAAIAIGHFRPHTVALLPEESEILKREGIELVHASELTQ